MKEGNKPVLEAQRRKETSSRSRPVNDRTACVNRRTNRLSLIVISYYSPTWRRNVYIVYPMLHRWGKGFRYHCCIQSHRDTDMMRTAGKSFSWLNSDASFLTSTLLQTCKLSPSQSVVLGHTVTVRREVAVLQPRCCHARVGMLQALAHT